MDSQLGSHPLCTQRRWMGATPTVLPVSSQKRETTPMAKRSTKQQRGGQNSHGDCRTPRPLRAVLETAKGLCVFVCVCVGGCGCGCGCGVCVVCVCVVCVFFPTLLFVSAQKGGGGGCGCGCGVCVVCVCVCGVWCVCVFFPTLLFVSAQKGSCQPA